MRQVPAEKYNIAWFKLAEFVARGEKERALGIYRLLIHSFDDKAFSYQLEGDLLAAFNDEQAHEKYLAAAELYYKEGRKDEAIAMYELLLYLKPMAMIYAQQLYQLYQLTQNGRSLIRIAQILQETHLQKKDVNAAEQLREQCKKLVSSQDYFPLCEQAVVMLIRYEASQDDVQRALDHALEIALDDVQTSTLQQFLSTLEATDKHYWHLATKLLQK